MFTNLVVTWNVDPVIFEIFGFGIRYYSLSWMIGFMACIYVMNKMMAKEGLPEQITDSMFVYIFVATVVGARVGHCLFYDGAYYLQHPLEILNLRQGGLASHGAAIGIPLGIYLFARKNKVQYIWALDRVATVALIAGVFIRLGNLFNSEIYGTATDRPWGFIFVQRGETIAMHPTQIYEALMYLAIFGLLTFLYFKKDLAVKRPGALVGLFFVFVFAGRFFIETIKNVQVDFEEALVLNMGQILSIPFIILGCVLLYIAYNKPYIFSAKKK